MTNIVQSDGEHLYNIPPPKSNRQTMNKILIDQLYSIYIDWIGNIDKEEGMARHGGASAAAVALLDHLAELINGHLATPYLKESAHDGTHHIA